MIHRHLEILAPNRLLLWGALVSLGLAELFPFCYPLLLSQTLDQLNGSVVAIAGSTLLTVYLGTVVLHSLVLYMRVYLGQRLSLDCNHRLRKTMFRHLQHLPMPLYQKTPIGKWMSRIINDTESYGNIFSEGLLELVSNVALLLFSMVFMLVLDWRLGLATMLFFPAMVLVSSWYRSHFRNLQLRFRESLAGLTAFLQEAINGVGLVQAFRRQSHMNRELHVVNSHYMGLSLSYANRYAGFFPLIQGLSDLSLVACYAMGLWLIAGDQISVGMLAAFAWYASIYSRPLRDISERVNSLQTSLASGQRVREFLELPSDPLDNTGRELVPSLKDNALAMDAVHFGYDPSRPVLNDLCFALPVGTSAAIVGQTGCGKSTTLQLLIAFLKPDQGRVLIFGRNVQEWSRQSLHRNMAWLAQEPFLFAGSLRENICMGTPYEEERFRQVCQQAQISGLLEALPQGELTLVGTGGQEISVGQRQLVAYARTLYQDPAILLLDEPSASIDASTGYELQVALRTLLRGRSAIMVTHRLASALICDKVFVMDQGKIVEQGVPQELLEQPHSRFSMLFREIPLDSPV